MKFWVGTTDWRWFDFLSTRGFDEVNFWQPSIRPPFVNTTGGMPFLFKLKRPYNHIAGGGFFIRHSAIPLSLAWEIFGSKNGAASLHDLKELLGPLARERSALNEIGCQIIANPFFLKPDQWLKDPPGWSSNIVRGKMYDATADDGLVIWEHVKPWFASNRQGEEFESVESSGAYKLREPAPAKYALERLIRPRIGQGAFRLALTDAYKRRCAITGESTLPVLEAAHIVPYAGDGDHEVTNGLLLRSDFHKLFDVGLVGITPDLRVRVSPQIREMWFNGKAYYRLENQQLAVVPEDSRCRPDPDRLHWHMTNIFQE